MGLTADGIYAFTCAECLDTVACLWNEYSHFKRQGRCDLCQAKHEEMNERKRKRELAKKLANEEPQQGGNDA